MNQNLYTQWALVFLNWQNTVITEWIHKFYIYISKYMYANNIKNAYMVFAWNNGCTSSVTIIGMKRSVGKTNLSSSLICCIYANAFGKSMNQFIHSFLSMGEIAA